jgi:hypothetical protein
MGCEIGFIGMQVAEPMVGIMPHDKEFEGIGGPGMKVFGIGLYSLASD